MKAIHVQGDQFIVGGTVRPIVTRSSFCLLGHYQSGNRDKAKQWLDRIQAQGFDGPRVFGENQDWFPGDKFYGTGHTPRIDAFLNHSGPSSKLKLRPGYAALVKEFIEDLIERDMVAEFCCVATIKGRDPGWTAHGLNKFAQMFADLLDPDDSPLLFEAVNEVFAHSVFHDDPAEVARFGPRWRRSSNEPSHHNFPGSTIGCSGRGSKNHWRPGFDDVGYTHRNIHPPRGDGWALGENDLPIADGLALSRAATRGKPLFLNETIHHMTQVQWDFWVEGAGGIAKWRGLSTTNTKALVQYAADVIGAGVSFCAHDWVGQTTDPGQPITEYEARMIELLGGITPPPPPPPADELIPPIVDAVIRGYDEILFRAPDPGGMQHYHDEIKNGMSEARFREVLLRDYLKGAR